MAVNYTVLADVVDLRSDRPKAGETFLVDTNVWFWLTYSRASQGASSYQTRDYPRYLSLLLAAAGRPYWCGLALAELAHLIEKTEREIFEKTAGPIPPKEFRHNHPAERRRVAQEVEAAWVQVAALGAPLETTVGAAATDAALARFLAQPLDGYDLFMVEAAVKAGVTQVLTDDGDFASVPGLRVFTANRTVIKTAAEQGRLLQR